MEKIVAYLRLSVEDGDDKESSSISNQRRIIEEYAEGNGLIISNFYIDDGHSGYSMDRPAFNRLKMDLNNDKVDVIIVKDLSRLGRHSAKVQLFLENIFDIGKRLIAPGNNYDTLNEESHTTVGIQTWVDEKLVKDTSQKVRKSLRALQKEGKLLCNVPYGYYKDLRDKNKCHVDHALAPHIRRVFDMYINGKGVRAIATMLTEENVPTPTAIKKQRKEVLGDPNRIQVSDKWDTSVIIRMLKNEFYLGTLVLNKTRTRSIKGKQVELPKEERLRFENHHEAIIDRQTFNLAQEIMKKRTCDHFRGIKSKTRKNIFSGIIYCADCERLLTTSCNYTRTRYLCKTYNIYGTSKCTSHAIAEADILEVLLDLLENCRDNLSDVISDIDEVIRAEMQSRSNKSDDTYDLVLMLEKSKKALEILIEQKIRETMKNPSMVDLIDKTYSEMQNEKYKEIQSLEKLIADQQVESINEARIKEDLNVALTTINEVLHSNDITKKQILMLVEKIIVHEDGGVDIFLKGNLHEFSNSYFKINENRMNKMKKHLCDYIISHPDKFTKGDCTTYIKEHGVETNYKIISKIINTELKDMVELRPCAHGYKLIVSTYEVERVLLSNIVVGTARCLRNNNVDFDFLIQICDWAEGMQYKKNIF